MKLYIFLSFLLLKLATSQDIAGTECKPVKTTNNQDCQFPFHYEGETYYTCYSFYGINEGKPSCGIAVSPTSDADIHECSIPTTDINGVENSEDCKFPFTYNNKQYYETITADNYAAEVCSKSSSTWDPAYAKYPGTQLCPGPLYTNLCDVTTRAWPGESPGDPGEPVQPPGTVGSCQFPFLYRKRSATSPYGIDYTIPYSTCAQYVSDPTLWWCSHLDIYDEAEETPWGMCPEGYYYDSGTNSVTIPTVRDINVDRKCTIPFTFNGVQYQGCTTNGLSQNYGQVQEYYSMSWCGLTSTVPVNTNYANGLDPARRGIDWDFCDTERANCPDNLELPPGPMSDDTQNCYIVAIGGRPSGEVMTCQFPFTYEYVVYDTCTTVGSNEPWCYTELQTSIDTDPGYHVNWGTCQLYGTTTDSNNQVKKCVFPFDYTANGQSSSQQIKTCTNIDMSDPLQFWCALTSTLSYSDLSNSNNQGVTWDYCNTDGTCDVLPVIDEVPNCPVATIDPDDAMANGPDCVFPFDYQPHTLSDGTVPAGMDNLQNCIDTDNDGQLWCYTQTQTNKYDRVEWGNCKIITHRSNSACSFPFIYNDKDGLNHEYKQCSTLDVTDSTQSWCATGSTDVTYEMLQDSTNTNWGYCDYRGECTTLPPPTMAFTLLQTELPEEAVTEEPTEDPTAATTAEPQDCPPPTFGGTAAGASCMIPFTYQGTEYTDCTTTGSSNGAAWCYTDDDNKWGYCTESTTGGTAGGDNCYFPFTYNQEAYVDCITDGNAGVYWCGTTDNVDDDNEWGNCNGWECPEPEPGCAQNVDGSGNAAEGTACVFPFVYNGEDYFTCTMDGDTSGKEWCSTTDDYDEDGFWGYCTGCVDEQCDRETENGDPCVLPFKYDGIQYDDCIDVDSDREWCSLTSDYDTYATWGYCTDECVGATGPPPTEEPTADPTTADPTPGPTDSGCASSSDTYYKEYTNQHGYGGDRVNSATTNSSCAEECDDDDDCTAYDFDEEIEGCFLFMSETERVDASWDVHHYVKTACESAATTRPPDSCTYAMVEGRGSSGGMEQSGTCPNSADECKKCCDNDNTCVGIDYSSTGCWTHTSSTIGSTYSATGVTQYTKGDECFQSRR